MLLLPRPVTNMLCTLHVLHKLSAVRYLVRPNHLMVSLKDAMRTVSPLLLTLMNMVLEGPSIKDQMAEETSPAAVTIAQLLKFNSVKHKRAPGTAAFVRHRT